MLQQREIDLQVLKELPPLIALDQVRCRHRWIATATPA